MKGKIIIIIHLFFSIFIFGQVNNGLVTYKKQFSKTIFTKDNSQKETLKKFSSLEKKIIESHKKIEYSLKFTKNSSIYEIIKSLKIENNLADELSADNTIYYNSEKENIEQKELMGDLFLITKKKLKWKLINELKIIGKFNCLKAETIITKMSKGKIKKLTKIAWYNPEINASFGPIGYSGLPGLIIELIDGNYKYTATKVELNTKDIYVIKPPQKGKKISESELSSLVSKIWGDIKEDKGF